MDEPRVWIGTSWKMTKTLAQARAYVDRLTSASIPPVVQAFVLPPLTALAAVRERLPTSSPVLLGAQDAHWAPQGAHTGEVSMDMVADAGASLVEVGHSERRAGGESDDDVARKVRAALDTGLRPLLCVGEPEHVRQAGLPAASAFVADQLEAALRLTHDGEAERVLVAYEPVWAIGEHGRVAGPHEAAPVLERLRADLAVRDAAGAVLLYGGSVTPAEAPRLLREAPVDGLFVGRAAWDAAGLLALVAIGAAHGRDIGA